MRRDERRGWAQGLWASLLALLLAGLAVPALADAEWTTPVDLSPPDRAGIDPQVAVDADGDAVFTWVRDGRTHDWIQARALSATGTLSGVQDLSDSSQDAGGPQVGVGADGDAWFTWTRFDGTNYRVQARKRTAAGTLSKVRNLSAPGQNAIAPRVAVNADGDAAFTWWSFEGSNSWIQARARPAGGTMSAAQDLSPSDGKASYPQVGIDGDGDAVFAWQGTDGTNLRMQDRRRTAAGALSNIRNVSPPGHDAYNPRVAVDPQGDAVFSWSLSTGGSYQAQTRARPADGALSAVQNLANPDQAGFPPEVAVDSDGDAVFTWVQWDGANFRAYGRARSAAGDLSPVQALSDNGRTATNPHVGVDADGNAVFVWQRPGSSTPTRVQSRTRSAGGALSKVKNLSGSELRADLSQVAVNPGGDAVVTWQLLVPGPGGLIQASTGP